MNQIPANIAWAASCAAHRINGEYVRDHISETVNETGPDGTIVAVQRIVKYPNREILLNLAKKPEQLLPEDYEKGEEYRRWVKGDAMKRVLKNNCGPFTRAAAELADQAVLTDGFGQLAILPSVAIKGLDKEYKLARLRNASAEYVGDVGTKVELDVMILGNVWSKNYNTFYISAIDDRNHAVFFSYKKELPVREIVPIKGTVSAHREGSTQLNRVKRRTIANV